MGGVFEASSHITGPGSLDLYNATNLGVVNIGSSVSLEGVTIDGDFAVAGVANSTAAPTADKMIFWFGVTLSLLLVWVRLLAKTGSVSASVKGTWSSRRRVSGCSNGVLVPRHIDEAERHMPLHRIDNVGPAFGSANVLVS